MGADCRNIPLLCVYTSSNLIGRSVLITSDCLKALITSVNMRFIYFVYFYILFWDLDMINNMFVPPQKSTVQSPAVLHLIISCV